MNNIEHKAVLKRFIRESVWQRLLGSRSVKEVGLDNIAAIVTPYFSEAIHLGVSEAEACEDACNNAGGLKLLIWEESGKTLTPTLIRSLCQTGRVQL